MIVDDHPLVREGLRALLARSQVVRVVSDCADGDDALQRLRSTPADVVLLDWMMPRMDGLEACRRIKSVSPSANVLMLTNHLEPDSVKKAIQAGAVGYLLKDVTFDELEAAILSASEGRSTFHQDAQRALAESLTPQRSGPLEALTSREADVLRLIARGRSNKEIARELNLTEGTVKGYVSIVLAKTGVADRTQAALLAVKLGLVDP